MKKDSDKKKKKIYEVKTFPVAFSFNEIKNNSTVTTNNYNQHSKEQIINQALKFHSQGKIKEAEKYYQYFINQGFEDYSVFSNYGVILKGLGKLKEAELSYRKAIELNPILGEAYFNLGNFLKASSQLNEALYNYKKAQECKMDQKKCITGMGRVLLDQGKHHQGIKKIREGEGSIIFDLNNGFLKI